MEAVDVVPFPEAVHVVPRRCRGVDVTPYTTHPVDPTKKRKIIITLREIETRLHLSSQEAALSFGISVTTLKKTCRLLGMKRWPYTRGGKSSSKSSSERSKNEAPPTIESPLWFPDSMYPLWDRELWDPDAGTHPLCRDACVSDLFFDEVPAEGCDLWFLCAKMYAAGIDPMCM